MAQIPTFDYFGVTSQRKKRPKSRSKLGQDIGLDVSRKKRNGAIKYSGINSDLFGSFDVVKLAAYVQIISLILLVVFVIIFTFVIYQKSPTVKVFTEFASEGTMVAKKVGDIAEEWNGSKRFSALERIYEKLAPQTPEEEDQVTAKVRQTGLDALQLLEDVQQSRLVSSVAELTHTITEIVGSEQFVKLLSATETAIPIFSDLLQKEETLQLMTATTGVLDRFTHILTEERVDKMLTAIENADGEKVTNAAMDLIKTATQTLGYANNLMKRGEAFVQRNGDDLRDIAEKVIAIEKRVANAITPEEYEAAIVRIKSIPLRKMLERAKALSQKIETLFSESVFGPDNMIDASAKEQMLNAAKNLTMEMALVVHKVGSSDMIENVDKLLEFANARLNDAEMDQLVPEMYSIVHSLAIMSQESVDTNALPEMVNLVKSLTTVDKMLTRLLFSHTSTQSVEPEQRDLARS